MIASEEQRGLAQVARGALTDAQASGALTSDAEELLALGCKVAEGQTWNVPSLARLTAHVLTSIGARSSAYPASWSGGFLEDVDSPRLAAVLSALGAALAPSTTQSASDETIFSLTFCAAATASLLASEGAKDGRERALRKVGNAYARGYYGAAPPTSVMTDRMAAAGAALWRAPRRAAQSSIWQVAPMGPTAWCVRRLESAPFHPFVPHEGFVVASAETARAILPLGARRRSGEGEPVEAWSVDDAPGGDGT